MTKRFCSSLLLSSCLFTTVLSGWGNAEYTPPSLVPAASPTLDVTSFPLNADQEWFVKPSLLVWRPYQDDIDSGFTLAFKSIQPIFSKDKTQNVDFQWGTGVRLNIGRYLPHHEQWDVTLATTYFYSDTRETIKGKGFDSPFTITDLVVVNPGWNPQILGSANLKTNLNWRINYFTWDLAVGRLYNLTRKLVIHPYLCLRTTLMYEKYTNKNLAAGFSDRGDVAWLNTSFKAYNSIWGIGPRIGSDVMFNFGRGWSFLGGFSGSIVMGRYHIKENLDGHLTVAQVFPSPKARLKIRDADSMMRANLEGNIGLGWEKWVRNHSVRIAPSFLFEVTEWFLINNWVATTIPATNGVPDWGMDSNRRMGDLGFLGFTVNLQIDF